MNSSGSRKVLTPPVRIIACEVFRHALEHLKLSDRYANISVTYLPSNLHNHPHEIKSRLQDEFKKARDRGERIICLYGNCFRDMDSLCAQYHAKRIRGGHCYEILLGQKGFADITGGSADTYFLEKDLILNFTEYCIQPLELGDPEMKEMIFRHYEKLLYVRQPSDPDLKEELKKISDFLGLSLGVHDADYSFLEEEIIGMIENRDKGQ